MSENEKNNKNNENNTMNEDKPKDDKETPEISSENTFDEEEQTLDAAEIAKINVQERSNIEFGRYVLRFRLLGLISISFCLVFFFLTALSGIVLHNWYSQKLIVKGAENFQASSDILLFANENITFIQGFHLTAAFLSIIFFLIYLYSNLHFQKLYTGNPLPGKTRTPSRFITSTVGLTILAMLVLNFLTGLAIPAKETTMDDFEKSISRIDTKETQNITTYEQLTKLSENFEFDDYKQSDGLHSEKSDSALFLHTIVLPMIFGFLFLVLLIDVYSLQKCKLGLEKKKGVKKH